MSADTKLAKRQQADAARRPEQAEYLPATDITELSGQIVMKLDMPGVSKENLDVTVEKGVLTVTGHIEEKDYGTAIYAETRVGDYRRQFSLDDDLDTESITAEINSGVLTVKIHKKEDTKPIKIQITGSEK